MRRHRARIDPFGEALPRRRMVSICYELLAGVRARRGQNYWSDTSPLYLLMGQKAEPNMAPTFLYRSV